MSISLISFQGHYFKMNRSVCDELFYKDMLEICDNTYNSSTLRATSSSGEGNVFDVDMKQLCIQGAEKVRKGVMDHGENNYTGNDSWCVDPCFVDYRSLLPNIGMKFKTLPLTHTNEKFL